MTMRSKAEKRLVAALIAITLLLTSLPYLLGYFLLGIKPAGTEFIGTAYNIDDYCNYLSWLRQTADGHFFLRNLFTTDPQKGLEFNILFWLLGLFVRVTHCPLQFAMQLARVGGGVGLLWLIYCFYRHCLPENPQARLTAFGFACLSSGLGWIPLLPGLPPDIWQPEAYTFLSIYASGLFSVSTILILGALYALLRGEETGHWKYAVIAGVCGDVLGNIHSYDVLHLAAAWGLFLVVWTVVQRGRGVGLSWARALLALAMTLPTTAYQYYVFAHDPIFKERANVPTLSPLLWYYFWGYGIVFLLAVVAAVWLTRVRQTSDTLADAKTPTSRTAIFLVCWAIAGLAIIYLPVAFQRKMLMGEHIPLCLLAGLGAAYITQRLSPTIRVALLAALVLMTIPSNVIFLRRDILHLEENVSETASAPYVDADQIAAAAWLHDHTPTDASVAGFPPLCVYLPGQTGRAVWAGHWGETPDYKHKLPKFIREFNVNTPDAERYAFLLSTRAEFLYYPNDVSALTFTHKKVRYEFVSLAATPPPYLVPVYRNGSFTIYRIIHF